MKNPQNDRGAFSLAQPNNTLTGLVGPLDYYERRNGFYSSLFCMVLLKTN